MRPSRLIEVQFQNDCISFWYKRCFPLRLGGWLSDVVRNPPPLQNPPPVRIVGGHLWRSVGYDVLLMLFVSSQWLYREECAWKRCYDAFSSGNFWEFSMSNANAPPNPPSQCWCWGSVPELLCSLFGGGTSEDGILGKSDFKLHLGKKTNKQTKRNANASICPIANKGLWTQNSWTLISVSAWRRDGAACEYKRNQRFRFSAPCWMLLCAIPLVIPTGLLLFTNKNPSCLFVAPSSVWLRVFVTQVWCEIQITRPKCSFCLHF